MKVLTFDIGGTFIKYAVMNENAEILLKDKVKTPQDTRQSLIDTLAEIFRKNDAEGIAISMPGIIDSENGYVAMGGALRYNDDFHLQDALYEVCPVKIRIANDAKCAAMAEAADGSLKDVKDGFVLIFGTMIGGGYIRDHDVVMGRHFSAGEISYITKDKNTHAAGNNVFGNLCGTPNLCRMYAEIKGLDPAGVNGITVFDAVNASDEEAMQVLDDYTKEIALQIFNLQTILDVERFAIGGGISAQPVFTDYIRRNLQKMYEECPYTTPEAEVVTCRYLNDANLIGALQFYLKK